MALKEIFKELELYDKGSKVIKAFNPNKSRYEFGCPPRFCINVYVGCIHQCVYCYNHWFKDFDKPRDKKEFEKGLRKDIERIKKYKLQHLITSISNSTDAFQEPLEDKFKHTLLAIRLLMENDLKVLFLTKNPKKLLEPEYLDSLNPENTAIEVTIPFLHHRKALEPFAPSPDERISCVGKLIKKGFNKLGVRVDPIIPPEIGGQSPEEIKYLIMELKDNGVEHVISKVFKLVGAIGKRHPGFYKNAKSHYLDEGATWHKNHHKLPENRKVELLSPVYEACEREGITLSVCYEDVPFPNVIKCDMAENKLGVCVNQ